MIAMAVLLVLIAVGVWFLVSLARRPKSQARIEAAEDAALERVMNADEPLDDATEALASRAARRKRLREEEEDRKRRFGPGPSAFVLLALALAAPAWAQVPEPKNGGPATVSVQAGGVVTLTGDAAAAITPTAFIDVDGPLVVGDGPKARVFARIGISAEPGDQLDLAQVATFRAAEVGLGAYVVVGRSQLGGQELLTGLIGEYGFATRLPAGEVLPAQRLVRHYGAGIRLAERSSGIAFTALIGRDEACGDRGWGQILLYGAVPVAGADVGGRRASVLLAGDASLALGPAVTWLRQRDVFRLGVVLDVGPKRP